MAANTGRLGKVAIKKEVTYGTYLEPDVPLRVTSESNELMIDNVEDPALIGEIFTTDLVKVNSKIEGGVELAAHPEEIGILSHMTLGSEAAVANPAQGYLFITYTGSEAYADLVISSGVITAAVGDSLATKAADTNFNTTGSIDTADAAFDTLAELAAAIESYTGWQATYKGLSTADTAQIADLAAYKLYENSVYIRTAVLECTIVSTLAKKHTLSPADATANLPSYTMIIDKTLGAGTAVAYTGVKTTAMSIAASAADLVKLSQTLKGQQEEGSKTYPTLTIPTTTPYKSCNMTVYLNGTALTVASDFTVSINDNLDEANVIGQCYPVEPIRQSGTIEASGTLHLNTTTYGYRSNYTAGTKVELIIHLETEAYADTGNTVVYSTVIRLNQVILTQYNSTLSSPDRLTISMAGTAVNSANHSTIEMSVVDQDVTTY